MSEQCTQRRRRSSSRARDVLNTARGPEGELESLLAITRDARAVIGRLTAGVDESHLHRADSLCKVAVDFADWTRPPGIFWSKLAEHGTGTAEPYVRALIAAVETFGLLRAQLSAAEAVAGDAFDPAGIADATATALARLDELVDAYRNFAGRLAGESWVVTAADIAETCDKELAVLHVTQPRACAAAGPTALGTDLGHEAASELKAATVLWVVTAVLMAVIAVVAAAVLHDLPPGGEPLAAELVRLSFAIPLAFLARWTAQEAMRRHARGKRLRLLEIQLRHVERYHAPFPPPDRQRSQEDLWHRVSETGSAAQVEKDDPAADVKVTDEVMSLLERLIELVKSLPGK